MKITFTRLFILSALCPGLVACGGDDNDGAPSGDPPPLFNAIDPSLQCPAGQVGWDFSTGGIDDIRRASVGREITVTEATLAGNCGATESTVRAACDGQEQCTVPLTCVDSEFTLQYTCGTEPSTYRARLENDSSGATQATLICGLPITIVKATYAPNAEEPADITAALAANCSGKRRCANGASGYQLNKYQDPLPGIAKRVEVRYVCGGEASEYVTDVDDFTLDIYCATEERRLSFNETLRIIDVKARFHASSTGQEKSNQEFARRQLDKLRTACDDKISCTVDLTEQLPYGFNSYLIRPEEDDFGQPGRMGQNITYVEYVCGEETEPTRIFMPSPTDSRPVAPFTLQCGEEMKILEAYVGASVNAATKTRLTEEMQEACDGKRACYAPTFLGGTYRYSDGTKIADQVTYRYTCGNLTDSIDFTTTINHYGGVTRHLECTPYDPDVFRGIRVAEVTPPEQTLAVTKGCFGRDECNVGSNTVKYRCGSSPVIESGTGTLTCKTAITILGVSDCRVSTQPRPGYCQSSPGACRVGPLYSAGQRCEKATVSYTCGSDPTVRTKTELNPDTSTNGYRGPEWISIECPTLADPYIRKECVPNACYGASTRDPELACIPDSTIQPTVSIQAPVINKWQMLADGSTSRYGGGPAPKVDDVTTLTSNFPYQAFSVVYYRADDGQQLPDDTNAVLWAYDEFERIDGAATAEPVFGFRCILGDAAFRNSNVPINNAAIKAAATGGKRAVIPRTCFEQSAFNLESTSWYDGAKLQHMSESDFRAQFRRKATYVVSALDPSSKNTVRRFGRIAVASNPIGFFYDPARDHVNRLGFYRGRTDFSRRVQVNFVQSKEIEISAVNQSVNASDLVVDVEKPELLPSFEVDFGWYLRGDSSSNPYSPRSKVANNPAGTSLRDRNLTATVEIARQDASLANPWIASNSVRFPAQPIEGVDPFIKTDRVKVNFTAEVRRRMLSVRGTGTGATADGFMSDTLDDDSTFLVRTCLDMKGMQRAQGDTDIDNQSLESLNGYSLKVTKRCSASSTIVVRRQLFVRPVAPLEAKEADNNRGTMSGSGDGDVAGGNDNGSQNSCAKRCTVSADCGSGVACGSDGICARTPANDSCTNNSRSQMGLSGQFPITVLSTRSDTATQQASGTSTATTTTAAETLGFTTFMPQSAQGSGSNTDSYQFTVTISPDVSTIIDLWKGKKIGPVSTDAKKNRMKKKRSTPSAGATEAGLDGLGLALSKEFFFSIGPVPLTLEVGLSVGLGVAVVVQLSGENAVAGQTSQFYPCLQTGGGRCFSVETTALSFEAANDSCLKQGGRLANVLTSTDLAEINTAIDAAGVAAQDLWLGGQAAYIYSYPPCEANGGVGPNGESNFCQPNSSTGYFWLTGEQFAAQKGQNAALLPVTGGSNGLGTTLSLGTSPVPTRAALAYRKSTPTAFSAPISQTKSYVCEFDAASTVVSQQISIAFVIGASSGATAALCLPSTKIGVCLAASLDFIAFALAFEGGTRKSSIYGGTGAELNSIIGTSYNKASWTASFLQGTIDLQFRFLFWSEGIRLKEFGWGPTYTDDLYNFPTSYYKDFQ